MAAYGMSPYYQDEHTIREPLIPYFGILPDRLRPGSVIEIKGNCNTFASRFAVNLVVGVDINAAASGNADIALHLNPRWSDDCVVKNHLQGGSWGQECREPNGRLPFSRMCEFKLEILVEERMYRIAVDGRHFAEFVHRIPVDYVGMLHIEGDLSVHRIKYGSAPIAAIPGGIPDYGRPAAAAYPVPPPLIPASPYPIGGGGGAYPTGPIYPPPQPAQPLYPPQPPSIPVYPPASAAVPYPPYPSGHSYAGPTSGSTYPPGGDESRLYPSVNPSAPYSPYQPASYGDVDLKHPPTPFHYRFGQGLRPGGVIEILGAPTAYARTFHIDLMRGPNVVSHTSVRLAERLVVRNVHVNGQWDYEERDLPSYDSFAFAPQREFHLVLRVGGDRIEATLNGQFLFTFRYRGPFDQLDAISIEGDVKLDDIRIEN